MPSLECRHAERNRELGRLQGSLVPIEQGFLAAIQLYSARGHSVLYLAYICTPRVFRNELVLTSSPELLALHPVRAFPSSAT
jgi:hypothetical protein